MVEKILTNWKTSAAGVLIAVATIAGVLIQPNLKNSYFISGQKRTLIMCQQKQEIQ